MRLALMLIVALVPLAAAAQQPNEDAKLRALKRAFEINGNTMVSDGRMIDVSQEDFGDNPPLPDPYPPAVSDVTPKRDDCKRHGRHRRKC